MAVYFRSNKIFATENFSFDLVKWTSSDFIMSLTCLSNTNKILTT